MQQAKRTLTWFLTTVALLIIIGLIFIYSSSSVFALEKFGSAQYFVKKQLVGVILGLIGMVVLAKIPIGTLRRFAPLFFFGALFLTALTLIPALTIKIHGSSRWLNLRLFAFQPSELLKLSFVPYLAYLLEKKKFVLSSLTHGFIPFLCIVGATAGVLLMQPDFGQAVTLGTTAFIIFFIFHTNMRYVMVTISALIPVLIFMVVWKPYRFNRILTFLDPWKDPQGAGFQIIQSLIAIGSGGATGVGIAESHQKFFYLPMQHTDFIFSIIAEETGFIGASGIIFLYMLFLYFGIRLAWYLKNVFCWLTVLGYTILITLQAIINLFVATGLTPTKGIGLPFMSYGNSSLVGSLCMIGVIICCVQQDEG